MTESKQRIIDAYTTFISTFNKLPTNADLIEAGINRSSVRDHFGNLSKLHRFFKDEFRELLDQHVAHGEYIFNEKRLKSIADQFKDTKVFIITTAVAGKRVDADLYDTISKYLDRRNGKLIVIASEDVASRQTKISDIVVDPLLRDQFYVTDEFRLNSNLFISNIRVSAKQILPTTGLARIGQTNGSYIFASPKQMLEFVATSPNEAHPKAIMTTGAITVADYSSDRWMSQRTSYIAEHDHTMGGIIVELQDDRYFQFRQFQANSKGEFVDLGVRYYPDGSVSREVTHMYSGDWHAGQTDSTAVNALFDICDTLEVDTFFVGDFFDGHSISHHHINHPLKMAIKAKEQSNDLRQELLVGGFDVNQIHAHIGGDIVMIRGNHDEVLERYLNDGNFMKDYHNMATSLELAKAMVDGEDPLVFAYAKYGQIKDFSRIVWLKRDDPYKIGDVECGQHGDMGANGSKGSLLSLEKAYGTCIVGHTHSGAIMRGVFRVGTMTKLVLEYNKGPSSWTQTCCLIYEDGSRQLINVVDGLMHFADKYVKEVLDEADRENEGKVGSEER